MTKEQMIEAAVEAAGIIIDEPGPAEAFAVAVAAEVKAQVGAGATVEVAVHWALIAGHNAASQVR